jgi:hypothetical protein
VAKVRIGARIGDRYADNTPISTTYPHYDCNWPCCRHSPSPMFQIKSLRNLPEMRSSSSRIVWIRALRISVKPHILTPFMAPSICEVLAMRFSMASNHRAWRAITKLTAMIEPPIETESKQEGISKRAAQPTESWGISYQSMLQLELGMQLLVVAQVERWQFQSRPSWPRSHGPYAIPCRYAQCQHSLA